MTPRDTAGAQLHQHWSPDTPPAPQPARAAAPGAVQDASCAWPRNLQHPQPQAGHRALQVARWEEEEGEEAPTDTLGQQPNLFIRKVNPTYLTVIRYFKPRSLAPAANDSEGTAHSSRLPTRPRRRQREGLGGSPGSVSPYRELARGH